MSNFRKSKNNQKEIGKRDRNGGILYVHYRKIC